MNFLSEACALESKSGFEPQRFFGIADPVLLKRFIVSWTVVLPH
jgi:hypothetical protein